ncbi:MAG: hypothetical protein HQL06_03990 [Nitrospirae bacterium]|nr:hypothetical protein [Nitrospirota bacterium]
MKVSKSGKGINMDLIKFSTVIILGLVIIVYSILLFTGGIGKQTVIIKKSNDPREIEAANKTVDTLLVNNTTGVVKEFSEINNYLKIKVDGSVWKKKSSKEKKEFLANLAQARAALGLSPYLKIVDYKSSIEYASFENNRPSLSETDF